MCFSCRAPQECKSWIPDCDACSCEVFYSNGACSSDGNACTSDVCRAAWNLKADLDVDPEALPFEDPVFYAALDDALRLPQDEAVWV
ncbi:MAG: hypothetical protein PVI86_14260, partial [Phycisphaerae bacterium]